MSNKLKYDTQYLKGFVSDKDLEEIWPEVEKAHRLLEERNGPGNESLGWMDLPENIDKGLIKNIEESAEKLNSISDALIVIGIGGSYLGARAAIEALAGRKERSKIFYAGCDLSSGHISEILESLDGKDISVNIISKSGTTTEPAIAFRLIERYLAEKYGEGNFTDRIICTTDREKGALKTIADQKGYKSFVIPDDVGGRFSVLTPVGLLPIAFSGINIKDLIEGAGEARNESLSCDMASNPSYKYGAVRNILYRKGKKIEILSNFDPRLHYISEWWKQLYGESEGKDMHSIFPAACDFSTDLHSMGQLVQQGERNIFETFLFVEKESDGFVIPENNDDLDNLNYLAGKKLDHVNRKAYEAACEAHFEGGVPNSTIFIPEKNAFSLGQVFYFFEKAVAISAYISGVNPFDQPGVEAYKQKMFRLLGKPGV